MSKKVMRPVMREVPRLITGRSPIHTRNMLSWLDPSEESTIKLNSGSVASMLNKVSGRPSADQSTAMLQPDYSLAAQNGLNALDFTAASMQWLQAPGAHDLAGTFMVFSVAKFDTVTLSPIAGSDNAVVFGTYWGAVSGTDFRGQSDTDFFTTYNGFTDTTGYHVFAWTRDGSDTMRQYIDGSLVSTNPSKTGLVALNTIGSRQSLNLQYFDGQQGDFIVYQMEPDAILRDDVEEFLSEKWGI